MTFLGTRAGPAALLSFTSVRSRFPFHRDKQSEATTLKPNTPLPADRAGTPFARNRRAAERHPCNLVAWWRRLGSPEDDLCAAGVWDITRNGVGLVIASRMQRGDVLLVTLQDPCGRFSQPLLVRVRRATAQPAGDWAAGCTFVTELGEGQLRALLGPASPPEPGPECKPSPGLLRPNGREERRSTPRRRGVHVPVLFVRPHNPAEVFEGEVLDRSGGGLNLSAPHPFSPGALLQLCPAPAPEGLPWVPVQIRHCSPEGRRWRLGCQFLGAPPTDVLLLFG
jgi:hypothetical protein